MQTGCLFAGIPASLFRAAAKCLRYAAVFAAKAFVRMGLYVPTAYLVYGGVLFLACGFEPFADTTDGRLYIFGFALSLLAALIIAVRRFAGRSAKERRAAVYSAKRGGEAPETPKVYRSRANKGVIVYEYADRYDLYEKRGDGIVLVDTLRKKDRR